MADIIESVLDHYPDADQKYVKRLQQRFCSYVHGSSKMVARMICDDLKNNGYPKRPPVDASLKIDYYSETCTEEIYSALYHRQAKKLLEKDFTKISAGQLCDMYANSGHRYARARKNILQILDRAGVQYKEKSHRNLYSSSRVGIVQYAAIRVKWGNTDNISTGELSLSNHLILLKKERRVAFMYFQIHKILRDEIRFVHQEVRNRVAKTDSELIEEAKDRHKRKVKCEKEEDRQIMASVVCDKEKNTGRTPKEEPEETEENHDDIEQCGVCYEDHQFEEMVQCMEGHLCCIECFQRYSEQAIFGDGKSKLECMAEDCEVVYPRAMMERYLPKQTVEKLDEKQMIEAIDLADIEDLFKCPACLFAAIIEPEVKIFTCMNPTCRKQWCTKCKVDWKKHNGKKCEELQRDPLGATQLRIKAEEKMTHIMVRNCPGCKVELIKDYQILSCNKMTCGPCKRTLCYVCREPDVTYGHFCSHEIPGGRRCPHNCCQLFTSYEEDDIRAMKEVRDQAQQDVKDMGYTDNCIGVPDSPVSKKQRTH